VVVVLVTGGVQMMMLGVLGEYLWRTLEAARNRPTYFLEETSEGTTEPHAQNVEHDLGRKFRV
jgi:dolichol-phosphate mannosyltransferase